MRRHRGCRGQGGAARQGVLIVAELKVALVSAERAIWQGTAKSIVAKTPDGEIGILPGHSPVLALLLDAPLRIETTD
ncbi:MAG: hypothetical protein ACO3UX_08320, partial [Candidatus Nanopelagicales bacterium]